MTPCGVQGRRERDLRDARCAQAGSARGDCVRSPRSACHGTLDGPCMAPVLQPLQHTAQGHDMAKEDRLCSPPLVNASRRSGCTPVPAPLRYTVPAILAVGERRTGGRVLLWWPGNLSENRGRHAWRLLRWCASLSYLWPLFSWACFLLCFSAAVPPPRKCNLVSKPPFAPAIEMLYSFFCVLCSQTAVCACPRKLKAAHHLGTRAAASGSMSPSRIQEKTYERPGEPQGWSIICTHTIRRW